MVEDVVVDEVVLPPLTVDVEDVDVDVVEVVVVTGSEEASAIATLLWYMLTGYELVVCHVPTPELDIGA